MFRFIAFSVWQKLHVYQEKRQMIKKVVVVFFLLRMEGSLTAPVPLSAMETNPGAHLMLFIVDNGLTVVRKK